MPGSERILLIEGNPESRARLAELLGQAGYAVTSFDTALAGLAALRRAGADLLLMDANLAGLDCREALAELKGAAATKLVRVVLLVGAGAAERALALDLGADDALSRPFEPAELLARVRAALRAGREIGDLAHKSEIAEQGQQIAHTAFEALAVTEKMARDASSLDRALKIGVSAVFLIALVMAVIFLLYRRQAQTESQRYNAVIARLEGGLTHQQDLLDQARKLRAEGVAGGVSTREQLQQKADQLKTQMAGANPDQVAALQKQLRETNDRLKKVEQQGEAAQNLIPSDVGSICLLHLTVAFRQQESGQRLRYAGLNPQGEPIQDSDGNPIMTLTGRGPEVRLEVFGTGFLVAAGGRTLTNHHVVEPWWKNDELSSLTDQGIKAEIALIEAYFPDSPQAFPAHVLKIAADADLALVQVDLGDASRKPLALDPGQGAAVSGQPVVSIGYATGLAALLARADDKTAQDIAQRASNDPPMILSELARRNLIRPIITQGHIGDVLPDKIVFDAQTTSGGSGGPLFNQQGKVIGVTYAVLNGFGGSNFGVPIRFFEPLVAH